MGIFYLAALIVGLGTILVQLALSAKAGELHAGDAGGEAHAELAAADADAGDAGHAGGAHDAAHDAKEVAADAGALALFLSMRFWTYALMAFGLVGTLLHFPGLAGPVVTLLLALGMGFASGLFAAWTFRALGAATASSGATARDAVGQVGRVLVPLSKGARGKVRIDLKGQAVDVLASTDDAELEEGAAVLVEEMRGTTAHVSRAPDGLGPRSARRR